LLILELADEVFQDEEFKLNKVRRFLKANQNSFHQFFRVGLESDRVSVPKFDSNGHLLINQRVLETFYQPPDVVLMRDIVSFNHFIDDEIKASIPEDCNSKRIIYLVLQSRKQIK
jgi:hypothetical protein